VSGAKTSPCPENEREMTKNSQLWKLDLVSIQLSYGDQKIGWLLEA
jgi:hypothetical protein